MNNEPVKGVVSRGFGRFYTVVYDGRDYTCVLRGKLRISDEWKAYSNPVAVGDIVSVVPCEDGSGTIVDIDERTNAFTRKDKKDRGAQRRQDIIAANVDLILVVQSFYDPHLNLRFVDRIAVRGCVEKIPTVLCVNKLDLSVDDYPAYVHEYYEGSGMEIFFTSTVTGDGVAELKKRLAGNRVIVVGYSGVGKSSLLNAMYPDEYVQATSPVSERSGKGCHTTTNVSLVRYGDGTELIDTPGVREFGLMDLEPHMLGNYFHEFGEHAAHCRFSPCTHDHEPGCEIKRLVDEGHISEGRYISYINILTSIKEYKDRIW